jgi:hypothetical protein
LLNFSPAIEMVETIEMTSSSNNSSSEPIGSLFSGDDFYNNLFSYLPPLLALFG